MIFEPGSGFRSSRRSSGQAARIRRSWSAAKPGEKRINCDRFG